jgi:hypothetical protein
MALKNRETSNNLDEVKEKREHPYESVLFLIHIQEISSLADR